MFFLNGRMGIASRGVAGAPPPAILIAMKKFAVLLAAAALAPVAFAEIKMPKIFSDNMVLQRGERVKIWGGADSGAAVRVEFGGKSASTKAGADGRWEVFLPPMEASAEPREMKIYENGKPAKAIKGALVGEVWVTGGQSNMQFEARAMDGGKEELDALPANLRYFAQDSGRISEKPLRDFAGWAE